MNSPIPPRRLAAPLTAIAAALTAVACTSHHSIDYGEHDSTGTGVPSGAVVETLPPLPPPWNTLARNSTDPSAVIIAAVQAVFDWHPERGDTSPQDAAHRAAPLFTPRAATDYRPYTIPRPTWQNWMDTRTTITAVTTISSEQHRADTAAEQQRKTTTVLTISTPGQSPAPFIVTSLVTAQKQPAWTVTGLAHLR